MLGTKWPKSRLIFECFRNLLIEMTTLQSIMRFLEVIFRQFHTFGTFDVKIEPLRCQKLSPWAMYEWPTLIFTTVPAPYVEFDLLFAILLAPGRPFFDLPNASWSSRLSLHTLMRKWSSKIWILLAWELNLVLKLAHFLRMPQAKCTFQAKMSISPKASLKNEPCWAHFWRMP